MFYSLGWDQYLDFDYVKHHRHELRDYVEDHYKLSVAVFMAVYMATAFFLPGAIILTLLAGFLFDVLPAALYINVSGTAGAILALLVSRYLVGHSIQTRHVERLKTLNETIGRYRHPVSHHVPGNPYSPLLCRQLPCRTYPYSHQNLHVDDFPRHTPRLYPLCVCGKRARLH